MQPEQNAHWLQELIPVLLAGQPEDWALRWSNDLQAALAGFGEPPAFRLMHVWQAETVLPVLLEAAIEGVETTDMLTLQQLHRRAALGYCPPCTGGPFPMPAVMPGPMRSPWSMPPRRPIRP